MAKIDFDGIKTKLKRDARPMLAGITVGPSVTYRLHGGTTKKKKKSKKRRRHPHSGYLGAWCPWWAPYDTEHGQHDPKFDPPSPTPSPDVSGGEVSGGAVADGGSASGGVAAGGGMVGESNGVSGESWGDYDVNDLAVISKTSPMQYARLSCNRLGLTEEQTNDLIGAISEEKSLFLDAISPMGGIALEGSPEADKLRKRGENGLYARGMIWNPSTKEVSGIFVGRGKEEPGCWWDNFAIFTGPATLDGVVIGESADNGLFFESVDEAVGFMVSSKMVEVPPESASDTLKMLRNGVADAISCYTPQLPKRHPFKVFKVCDVPTKEVKQWSYVCEAVEGTDQDKLVDTPAFKRWFGSSKIVDGNGRPMVVYHGTRNTFDKFDKHVGKLGNPLDRSSDSRADNGLFFTDNFDMAEAFSGGKEPLACYLRMEHPLVIDAHGEPWIKPLFKFVDGNGMEVKYEDIGKKGVYPYSYVPVHPDLPKAIADYADELSFPDTFSYDLIPSLVNSSTLCYEYDGVIIRNVLEGNGAAADYENDAWGGHVEGAKDASGNDKWLCTDYVVLDPKQIKEWHNNGKFSRRTANIYESISDEDIEAARNSNDLSANGFWDCDDDDDRRIKENMFDEAVGFVDGLPAKIPVYRAISLHGKKFDSEMPGTSWSKYPDSALAFGGHNWSDTFLIGEVDKKDCDVRAMIVNYCLFSGSYDGDDENEIVVNDYGAPVRISRIIPMSEAKKEFGRKK